MNIQRFVKDNARPAHHGTILASEFFPEGVTPPCRGAWGYLEAGKGMEPHAHAHEEIYAIFTGRAVMTVAGESAEVGPGDVVAIPGDAEHTIEATSDGPLLWAAMWWE